MMTIHRVSAGDGYEYYTREVASDDERRERTQELGDYYLKSGAPAGVWMGEEITRHFGITGEVTEQQMRDLFGQGKRPDAQMIRDAKNGVVDERNLLLGNPYAVYPAFHQEFTDAVSKAVDDFRNDNNEAEPDRRQMAQIRRRVAHSMFVADRHREPASADELTRFLTTQASTSPQAVAGFDLTFSVPKSVSVLWALGDKDLRARVEQAHTRAIADTLDWLQADVIGSRAGRNGVRRVSVDGVMAARFRHYDSRAGDPQLHDHTLVSNKVWVPFGFNNDDGTPAGVWRTIDSKALYKAVVASSTRYDNALMSHLASDLGVTFEQRGGGESATKMEIADVPETLIEQFSTRRTSIKGRLDELIKQYARTHGSRPGRVTVMHLAQQATLETRRPKRSVPLPDRIRQWRAATAVRYTAASLDAAKEARAAQARHEPTARQRLAQLLRRQPPADPSSQARPVDDAVLAQRVVAALEERRSTWTLRHVQAEVARQLAAATAGANCDGDRITLLASRVINDPDSILLSRPEPILHKARADKNGVSVYDHPDMWRYTSPGVIHRETQLLDTAEKELIGPVTDAVVERVLADAAIKGAPLGADQVRMVRTLATSPRAVVTAVGPAGAGKTTAMRALAQAVAQQGATLIGLAPSAVAARELGDALEVEAMTIQRWLTKEAWTDLKPGDVVLVDEAAMVGNTSLSAVVERAVDAGATVRMIGDPAQLGAVDANGAFELLHRTSPDPVELDRVWRFKDPAEADASLELRSGPADVAFTWYQDNDRIRGGAEQEILSEAHAAWKADHDAGLTTLIVASTTERVAALNDQISVSRAAAGETADAPHLVSTRDGQVIRLGDTVLARRNDPSNKYGRQGQHFVRNGDLFTVTDVAADGSLTVRATDQSLVQLEADYTAKHVQLGYAATVHRSQGITVDTAHAVLDAGVDRSLAYVAMTRGRQNNTAWLVVEDDQPVSAVLTAIAERTSDNPSAIAAAAQEARDARDPVRMRDIYNDLAATADRIRWSECLNELAESGRIPPQAARALKSSEFTEVVSRLNRLEADGVNINTVLADLTQPMNHQEERPQDPAIFLVERIDEWRSKYPSITDPHYDGPGDDDLAARSLAQAQRRRWLLPDKPNVQSEGDGERLTAWTASEAALTDPRTPKTWKEALSDQYARLADVVRDAGSRALNEADWAQGLKRPADMSQTAWEQAVGEIATYRSVNRVSDRTPLDETFNATIGDEAPVRAVVDRLTPAASKETRSDRVDDALGEAERALAAARRHAAIDDALQAARKSLSERANDQSHSPKAQQQAPARRQAPRGPHL